MLAQGHVAPVLPGIWLGLLVVCGGLSEEASAVKRATDKVWAWAALLGHLSCHC